MKDPKVIDSKVIFGPCRQAFTHVFTKHSASDEDEGKFSTTIMIPKDEKKTVAAIEKAIEAAKKAGENMLKDTLLRSVEFSEENILRDKTKHVVTVSSEFVTDLSEWCKAKTGVNPLADVFGTNLTDEEVREKTVAFLYDFSAKLKWSDRDRYIWCRRFIINADPEGLAEEVGHDRAWLDTRYSRLNAKFKKAIKEWWRSHAL